ncbi:hypothetical protein Tco_0671773 [Tanacetum coccineum]
MTQLATYIDTTLIPDEIPTVLPIIPLSPDYTPRDSAHLITHPANLKRSLRPLKTSEDPSSDHIPPLPVTLPFPSSTDDSSDSDTPDIPPSPIHGTPFTEITLSTQSSLAASTLHNVASHDLATRLQPIPRGPTVPLTYPNGPVFHDYKQKEGSSHQLCSSVLGIPYSSTVITERPSHPSSTSPSRKRSRSSDSTRNLEERVTHLVLPDDIPKPAQEEGAIEGTYETLGDLVQRFHDHTEEILVYRYDPVSSSAAGTRDAARNLEPHGKGGEQKRQKCLMTYKVEMEDDGNGGGNKEIEECNEKWRKWKM